MSKENNLHDFLTDVADAIREKKGSSEKINPQNFSEEIKNLPSGASPFAVDFGEEIATGNPAFIGALQEDIDFYNEVKSRIAAGENINLIWQDIEFKERIAWIPPEMLTDFGLNHVGECTNLFNYPYDRLPSGLYNNMVYTKRLHSIKADASDVTRLGYFLCSGYAGDIELSFSSLTKIEGSTMSTFVANKIVLDFPQVTTCAANNFYNLRGCKYIDVNFPKLEKLQSNNFRECGVEELYLNIPSVTSQSYSVYINNKLRVCHLKGMQCSFNIGSAKLELESVKYILDHCQARADGASYTLTLNATVKQNFMNKCTEGHADYDAEYAASLASANSKGLTLA